MRRESPETDLAIGTATIILIITIDTREGIKDRAGKKNPQKRMFLIQMKILMTNPESRKAKWTLTRSWHSKNTNSTRSITIVIICHRQMHMRSAIDAPFSVDNLP
jgi:hypothetical protein